MVLQPLISMFLSGASHRDTDLVSGAEEEVGDAWGSNSTFPSREQLSLSAREGSEPRLPVTLGTARAVTALEVLRDTGHFFHLTTKSVMRKSSQKEWD